MSRFAALLFLFISCSLPLSPPSPLSPLCARRASKKLVEEVKIVVKIVVNTPQTESACLHGLWVQHFQVLWVKHFQLDALRWIMLPNVYRWRKRCTTGWLRHWRTCSHNGEGKVTTSGQESGVRCVETSNYRLISRTLRGLSTCRGTPPRALGE